MKIRLLRTDRHDEATCRFSWFCERTKKFTFRILFKGYGAL